MKPSNVDPKEQAFIERALVAAARAQRLDQVRMIVASAVAIIAVIWFAVRLPGPELPIEATVIVAIGAMLAAATAKIRLVIHRNTNIVLQAIAAQRARAD